MSTLTRFFFFKSLFRYFSGKRVMVPTILEIHVKSNPSQLQIFPEKN